MTTHRQLTANRANAKLSTGPKTSSGKARSCKNAIRHGLTAQAVVIDGEDPREFDALLASLEREFEPQSALQIELVRYIAGLIWRLRRIPAFEAFFLDAHRRAAGLGHRNVNVIITLVEPDGTIDKDLTDMHSRKPEPEPPASDPGLALIRDIEHHDMLGRLSRYEAGLINALTRTLSLLEPNSRTKRR